MLEIASAFGALAFLAYGAALVMHLAECKRPARAVFFIGWVFLLGFWAALWIEYRGGR